jgi:hypothetical protein
MRPFTVVLLAHLLILNGCSFTSIYGVKTDLEYGSALSKEERAARLEHCQSNNQSSAVTADTALSLLWGLLAAVALYAVTTEEIPEDCGDGSYQICSSKFITVPVAIMGGVGVATHGISGYWGASQVEKCRAVKHRP